MDSSDLFREAKLAVSMVNFLWGAPQVTSRQMLRMLTINAARALGLADELGSLEPGKQADLILLDFRQPKFRPLNNLPALLINTAIDDDVDTLIVGGRVLMQKRHILTMNEATIVDEAQRVVDEIAKVTGWRISMVESRPPRKPVYLRMALPAKAICWIARLGWQFVKERIRPKRNK
jgi:5-methylthioadenosine/S-adenosylhomocysteine deaminase